MNILTKITNHWFAEYLENKFPDIQLFKLDDTNEYCLYKNGIQFTEIFNSIESLSETLFDNLVILVKKNNKYNVITIYTGALMFKEWLDFIDIDNNIVTHKDAKGKFTNNYTLTLTGKNSIYNLVMNFVDNIYNNVINSKYQYKEIPNNFNIY